MNQPRITSKTGFTLFIEVLQRHIEVARSNNEQVGLVLVGLENLRRINTSLGYEVGRQMLVDVADRLHSVCRARDRIVQYSDYGFALILNGVQNAGHAELAANKVWREFGGQTTVAGHRVVVELQMGIALFPDHGSCALELMQAAEVAQDTATSTCHWKVYTPEQTAEVTGMIGIEADLESALHEGQLEMHYQPKLSLSDGNPCGVEALMRWFHPQRGTIAPDVFIGLAERMGKMEDLTWFALNTGLRQMREWTVGARLPNVAINVTPQIVQKTEFADLVINALQVWDAQPEQLTIEVTETALMTNPDASFRTLSTLRTHGVKISIDDFGTGYSSLAYFKNIPATELKIDRSFVFKMLDNPGDRQIVQTIIDLAHGFGLQVVAEGIENRETETALVAMGCDVAQGYFYSKPLSHANISNWLAEPVEIQLADKISA